MKLFEQAEPERRLAARERVRDYPSQSADEESVLNSLSKLDMQCLLLFVIPDGFYRRRIEPDPLLHSPY
jgi:hypothetical protein